MNEKEILAILNAQEQTDFSDIETAILKGFEKEVLIIVINLLCENK
jgi:hypothetical protein